MRPCLGDLDVPGDQHPDREAVAYSCCSNGVTGKDGGNGSDGKGDGGVETSGSNSTRLENSTGLRCVF